MKGVMQFPGVQHGLNTNDPASLISPTEAAKLLNWQILEGGVAKVRPPIAKFTSAACDGKIYRIGAGPIPSHGVAVFCADSDKNVYYLKYTGGAIPAEPTKISPVLELAPSGNEIHFVPYGGYTIVLDSNNIKYVSSTTLIKPCYDNGSGSTAYQTNNLSDVSDTFLALGNGTNTRIAQKFTSQGWDLGTIPPTTISVNLSANGTPNASAVNAVLRLVSDDSTLATVELVADASTLSTEDTYTADFSDGTITTEMSASTAMYISLEHTGGDASNYVKVHCNNCSSGGLSFYYAGSWSADTAKNCILGLKPGMAPKATFGTVVDDRLFVSGDSSNDGRVYYCNRTPFDWSTTDLGGYFDVVDDDTSGYLGVGWLTSLYGKLYIFGTPHEPYLHVLNGDTPAEYSVQKLFQNIWVPPDSVENTGNDIWYFSKSGMSALSGVQEFGDLRYSDYSKPIRDKIDDNYVRYGSTTGYDPETGLVHLSFDWEGAGSSTPTSPNTIAINTRAPVQDPSGIGLRYPWMEFQYYGADLTSATYKWTLSSGEYYLEAAAGGDPSIAEPEGIVMDGVVLTIGTKGSLADHEWDYAQDPGASYNTIWLKDASGDPDTTGVTIKTVLRPTCYFYDNVGGSYGTPNFIFGSSDKYIYYFKPSETQDNGTVEIEPEWRGKNYQFNDYATLIKQQVLLDGDDGATFSLSIYKNDDLDTAAKTYSHTETPGTKKYKHMRCTGYSFQPRIHGVTLNAIQPLFRGAVFEYEKS